jgi:hypothetical protein
VTLKVLDVFLDFRIVHIAIFLLIISESFPIMDEICKRSARFVMACLFPLSNLVRSVAYYNVKFAGYNSPLDSNALFCCQRYGFDLELFRSYSVSLDQRA